MNKETSPEFDQEIIEDPTSLEILRRAIVNSRVRTEAEFEKQTANIWPACLMTDLHTAFLTFDIHAGRGKVDPVEFERIGEKLDKFIEEVRHMYATYNTKDKFPTDEEKDRIFEKFDSIGAEMLSAIQH